jgi:hypothetical protein
VSLDGGMNWLWDRNTANTVSNFSNGNFAPSWYWAGGFGYRIGLKNNKDAILLHAGFSYKYLIESVNTSFACLFPPCPNYTERYNYKFGRFSLKAGWRF